LSGPAPGWPCSSAPSALVASCMSDMWPTSSPWRSGSRRRPPMKHERRRNSPAPAVPSRGAEGRVSLKIFIADDHEVVRHGLRALLENGTGWSVCGEAVDGRQAVDRVLELQPDMVVMDVSMPQLNGLEATRQIVRQAPRIPV